MGVQDLPTFITYSGSLFPRTLTFYFKPSPIKVVYFPIPFLTGYIEFGYFRLGMVGQVRLGMVGLRTHKYSSRFYAISNI